MLYSGIYDVIHLIVISFLLKQFLMFLNVYTCYFLISETF